MHAYYDYLIVAPVLFCHFNIEDKLKGIENLTMAYAVNLQKNSCYSRPLSCFLSFRKEL